MDQDQRTAVAGLTVRGKGPKRGEVVAERYEIRGRLRNDVFSLGFLAFDQEEEHSVLLRLIRPELLDVTVRPDVAARMRAHAGVGGNYLPGLLDGDCDGPYVFATEPVPEGASFRDVLDRRIKDARPLKPFELLPLVSHIEAALLAVPEGMRHGDVRAENVWTDAERLQLTGSFFLPAMPAGSVAAVVQRHSGLRRRFAPELATGEQSNTSDAYGVAAIVYEALTLTAPTGSGACDAVANPDLESVLRPLLLPNPIGRARSLGDLVEVLARLAELPVPELEPAPFNRNPIRPRPSSVPPVVIPSRRKPRKTDVTGPRTDVARAPQSPDDDGLPPPPDVSEDDRTQPRASIRDIKDEGLRRRAEAALKASQVQRAKRQNLTETERRTRAAAAGLDPRLVRAALADNEEGSHHFPAADTDSEFDSSGHKELDPLEAPLQMALGTVPAMADEQTIEERTSEGVPLDPSVAVGPSAHGTQEVAFEDLEEFEDNVAAADEIDFPESEEVPLDPSVPVKPAKGGTQEIGFDELESMERAAGGGDPSPPVALEDLAGMSKSLSKVPVPRVSAAARLSPEPSAPVVFGVPAKTAPSPLWPQEESAPSFASERVVETEVPAPLQVPARVLAPSSAPPLHKTEQLAPRLELAEPPVTEATTSPGAQKLRRRGAKTMKMEAPARRSDQAIIIIALILGALMIAGGILLARHRRETEAEQRQQRLQERFERLQQQQREQSP